MTIDISSIIGVCFNRLTVVDFYKPTKSGQKRVLCQCLCGNFTAVGLGNLKNGHTKSCGCLIKERTTTHTMSTTKEYKTWVNIRSRCYNLNSTGYKNYGGRGIKVCDQWKDSFENFYKDMGDCPSTSSSIERVNNNGDYSPENCKWATGTEQGNNKRGNHLITYNDEVLTISQWAEKLNILPNTILYRIRRGWSVDEALEIVPRKYKYKGRLTSKEIQWMIDTIDSGNSIRYCSKKLKIDESQVSRLYKKFKAGVYDE